MNIKRLFVTLVFFVSFYINCFGQSPKVNVTADASYSLATVDDAYRSQSTQGKR